MKNIGLLINNNLFVGAIIAFVCLYFGFILFSGSVFRLHSQNEHDRQLLLKIRNDMELGNNYEKVLQNFWSKNNKNSDLRINVYSPESWLITMESEFGETDWRMNVKFNEGKVVGYKIRTTDGQKPLDAPEDIGKIDE